MQKDLLAWLLLEQLDALLADHYHNERKNSAFSEMYRYIEMNGFVKILYLNIEWNQDGNCVSKIGLNVND